MKQCTSDDLISKIISSIDGVEKYSKEIIFNFTNNESYSLIADNNDPDCYPICELKEFIFYNDKESHNVLLDNYSDQKDDLNLLNNSVIEKIEEESGGCSDEYQNTNCCDIYISIITNKYTIDIHWSYCGLYNIDLGDPVIDYYRNNIN